MSKTHATVQLLLIASAAVVFCAAVVSRTASRAHAQSSPPNADLATRTVINRFNEAFNRHDPDAVAALLTEDTVFEDTSPPPDGQRIEGKATVVGFWRDWFARNPDARFEAEEIIVTGDRAVVRLYIGRFARDSPGICAAWISSRYATGRWPRSSRTSKGKRLQLAHLQAPGARAWSSRRVAGVRTRRGAAFRRRSLAAGACDGQSSGPYERGRVSGRSLGRM
jgi:ketosteroid isomerase-like protein